LVGPFEDDLNAWGKGSYAFAKGECAWCHPGGGPLEYDRDGYRYDGSGAAGANPNRIGEDPQAGVPVVDPSGNVLSINPDGIRYGDYWVYDNANGVLVDKSGAWETTGVAEVDCLWCHYEGYYNYQARNYCISEIGGKKGLEYGPSFGLVGTKQAGEIAIALMKDGKRGEDGSVGTSKSGNPSCEIIGYSPLSTGFPGATGVIPDGQIVRSPDKTDCALCHKADVAWDDLGPADVPLGFTSFQKFIPADPTGPTSCTDDSDCVYGDPLDPLNPGFCNSDTNTCNTKSYYISKGRAEFGKRAESINDPRNPEVHMDNGFICVDCHYLLGRQRVLTTEGLPTHTYIPQTFDLIEDDLGRLVQPGIDAIGMDHQFAKGNNSPDGKNMDQLDNTVTCKACHVDHNHPNVFPDTQNPGEYVVITRKAGLVKLPIPTHPAFPSFHFERIDCRTCHIYEQNFVKKETVTDYTSTPYPMDGAGGEGGATRSQSLFDATGIHYKPLRVWGCREHNCKPGEMFIQPATTMINAIWKDQTDNLPYAKRTATEASKILRQIMSTSANGPFSWTLNAEQDGEKALIINTSEEISNMVSILQGNQVGGFGPLAIDAQLKDPVIDLMLTTFTTSHNRSNERPLGGKGCAECHASSDPANPYYDPLAKDVGFFDKQFELFKQPAVDGLQMTCDNNDCSEPANTKRIEAHFKFPCNVGPTVEIDLTENVAHGQPIKNTLEQSEILCYDQQYLANLMAPQSSAYFANLKAEFNWLADATVSRRINLNGSFSLCPPGQVCTYSWDYGEAAAAVVATDPVKPVVTYTAAGSYNVTLTVEDEHGYTATKTRTVLATDIAAVTVSTAAAVDNADGSATLTVTAGVVNLKSFYALWNDGSAVQPVNAYNMTSREVTHQFVGAPNTFTMAVYVIDMQGKGQLIWLAPLAVTGP
jgi:hypothetical protein